MAPGAAIRGRQRALHWSVGCGTFGLLSGPDGTPTLIETLRFDEREACVVRLTDGARELVAWVTGAYTLQLLDDDSAAARVGMPAPRRIKVGGGWRRIDPFHTERHRSRRFRALVATIYAEKLPCRYSLLAAAEHNGRIPDFAGPAEEDPEQTAGNTAERLVRLPALNYSEALRAELLDDAAIAVGPGAAAQLLDRVGWTPVLSDLERYLHEYASDVPAPPPGAQAERLAVTRPVPQMRLFEPPPDGATHR